MAQFVAPNLYILTGAGGIEVVYTPNGPNGPDLFYGDPANPQHFSGDQVSTLQSPLGSLVTVILNRPIDFGSARTLTLVVPNLNLASTASQTVNTIAIITLDRISFPFNVVGQLQFYTEITLQGTALV
jgi:hypothetical protein